MKECNRNERRERKKEREGEGVRDVDGVADRAIESSMRRIQSTSKAREEWRRVALRLGSWAREAGQNGRLNGRAGGEGEEKGNEQRARPRREGEAATPERTHHLSLHRITISKGGGRGRRGREVSKGEERSRRETEGADAIKKVDKIMAGRGRKEIRAQQNRQGRS